MISPSSVPSSPMKQRVWLQGSLVVVLTLIVAIAALPAYFSGQWPWTTQLTVPQIDSLRALPTTPLVLPGWQLARQQSVNISGSDWILAEYAQTADSTAAEGGQFALLMRPQTGHDKQPTVEWVDLVGSQGWRVSDRQSLQFSLPSSAGGAATVTARYFRGVAEHQTFAVMQWYAWPGGGHAAPGRWFWADQARQWRQRERLPWVAVCLLLPIEPVGNIRPYSDQMITLAQQVQTRLMEEVFATP